jgi:hypothetical protein
LLWRVLMILIAAAAVIAAARPQSEKEIRFPSVDGRNVVTLSSEGLTLSSSGKPLAQLSFITVGDGERQNVSLKLNGQISVESGIITVGTFGKQRVAIRPEGLLIDQGNAIRATLRNGLLSLADPTGRTTAEMSADEKGIVSLSLAYDRKVIAELGSEGRFVDSDPPKRTSSALMLNDFGPSPKSRMITPSSDDTRGTK